MLSLACDPEQRRFKFELEPNEMANYCIMRVKKRRTGEAAAMARHALRQENVHNADPSRRGLNEILIGAGSVDAVMATLRHKLPPKRRRDAVTCLEFFIGASPEAVAAMSKEQQRAYFERALVWVGWRFGGIENIVSAVVHRDETSAHLQVLTVPLLNGRLNAKQLVGNRQHLQAHQDSFAEIVGASHGLRRGVRGSRAKHTSIRQFYGAIQAAGSAEALPPRMSVPEMPRELPFWATTEQRSARDAALKRRDEALASNRRRQSEIERLARLALATHGRASRRYPDPEAARIQTERAETLLASQRTEFNARANRLSQLQERLDVAARNLKEVERVRDGLLKEIGAINPELARDPGLDSKITQAEK
ncbi:MAG: MobV family relaxase [Pigmentiphaga sp.]